MKRFVGTLLLLVLFSLPSRGQELSGRYNVTLTLGPGNQQNLLLIVVADGGAARGSIGPDGTHRLFFNGGTVKADTVSFNVAGLSNVVTIMGSSLTGFVSPPEKTTKWPMNGMRVGDVTLEDRYAPLANEDSPYRSPKLVAFRDAMERHIPRAEQTFLDSLKSGGEPLVEPVPGDLTRSIVTFVWVGSPKTKSVLLQRGRFTKFQPEQNLFAHVEESNVWFKTLVIPAASRFQYAIAENDPSATYPRGDGQSIEHYDPINPRHLPEDGNAPEASWHSLLELPGAAPQPWYVQHSGTSKYEVREEVMESHILGEKRDLRIYLPPGYEEGKTTLPVLYMFDGEDPDGLVFATWTLENLLAAHRIPPLIVVRIINPTPALREKELGCNPNFADFMARELVPFLRARYRITSAASLTGVAGYSRGGLAAAYVALRHPETFGLALAQSGAFWWEPGERENIYVEPNWLTKQYLASPKLSIRFYLEAGLFEVDLQGAGGDILETTRTLRDVLRAKGNNVVYNEFAGEHDYINWRGTFADAIVALYRTDAEVKEGGPK
jgi:enterochelin esterase-like enzyme